MVDTIVSILTMQRIDCPAHSQRNAEVSAPSDARDLWPQAMLQRLTSRVRSAEGIGVGESPGQLANGRRDSRVRAAASRTTARSGATVSPASVPSAGGPAAASRSTLR